MARYSLEQLKEKGLKIAAHNKLDKLFATSDGQFFLQSSENGARFHAKQKNLQLHILEYSKESNAQKPAADSVKKTVEQRIAEIQSAESFEVIENLVKGEKSKAVLQVATERITELKAAAEADERK